MLTPADIEKKQFTTTRFKEGYLPQEVDEFLDRVASDYAESTNRAEELRSELQASRRPVRGDTQPNMESVNRVLLVAQQTAEKQLAEAKTQAAGIVSEANMEAAAVRQEADADRLARFADLDEQCSALTAKVEELKTREAHLRSEYQKWLSATQSVLERELQQTKAGEPSE